jgi:hypothetical protein
MDTGTNQKTALIFCLDLLLVLILLTPVNAQTEKYWAKTYGGAGNDYGFSVVQTSDGGYVIAGDTSSFGLGGSDIYLVKTDSSGNQLWQRTYGGAGDDVGYSVQQTSDGGYVIAGWTTSFGAGGYDIYLVKTDSSGNQLWQGTYGGTGNEEGCSVQQTSDGGYIIAGYVTPFGSGGSDVYLVKTDSLGNQLWDRTYGGAGEYAGFSVKQTPDGGYVIAGYASKIVGYSSLSNVGDYDVYLVKTDSLGNQLWQRTYGGKRNDASFSVQLTSDGGYVIAGYTGSFGAGGYDVYLVKTDSSGNQLWQGTYGGAGNDFGYSVQQTSDGGYVIAGYSTSFGAGGYDVYLVRTDASGNQLWQRTYGGAGDDYGYTIQLTSDGGYAIAGWTTSFGAGGYDFYLIKPEGDSVSTTSSNPTSIYLPNWVTLASIMSVFVVGSIIFYIFYKIRRASPQMGSSNIQLFHRMLV